MTTEKQITLPDRILLNVKRDGSKIVCASCGGLDSEIIGHMDNPEFYVNLYECTCGNPILVKIRRKGVTV